MSRKSLPSDLVPVVANNYWRERDAERVLSVWAQSGLTLSAFARHCGLSVRRLRRWKDRLESRGAAVFHPVEVVVDRDDDRGSGVELVLGCGRRITVHRGFDRAVLLELIEALESC